MNLNIEKTIDYYVGGFLLLVVKPVVCAIGKILHRDHTLTIRGPILFIKMMGGGSLLLALPLILGLKQANPSKSVWIVTTPSVKPFAEILGAFDRIIIIDNRSIHRLILTAAKALLQCLATDTVIDLEVHSRLTTLFSLFTMARNRLGFYLERVFWRKNLHTHLIFYNCFPPSSFFLSLFFFLVLTFIVSLPLYFISLTVYFLFF